ncbi:MAG: ABC transporter permease [Mycobacteriaceae bacterium]
MSADTATRTVQHPPLGATQSVWLVALREIKTRTRSKAFLISNAVLVVLIVGGIIAASVLSGGSDSPDKVGVVGSPALQQNLGAVGKSLGTPVTASAVPDAAAARSAVSSGDLDVALVPASGGAYTAVTKDDLSDGLRTVLQSAVGQQAGDAVLSAQGVDPATVARATAAATVSVDAINPPKAVNGQRLALAYISVLLLYFQLLTAGISVATGVVEEKTSRVVELLLATMKPVHLLVGKVLGIGVVGLVQLAVYGVAGLSAALGTGLLTVTGAAITVFISTLGWFVLGFAFFAMLYAAAGSMVSRQEDIGSTTTPLTFLVVAMFLLAQVTLSNPDGTLSNVMAWIPPFSAILMPLRIAAGVASGVQVVGSVVLMLAVIAALAQASAKIYERSVLHSGSRVRWKQALGRG